MDARFGQDQHEKRCVYRGEGQHHDRERRPYLSSVGEYGWVAVPVGTNWVAGQKYVYTLDFSNGAGRVDPEKPDPTDPDPFEPGEPILGDPIKFTVTVTPWVDAPQNLNM